jgi:hypothetical protein
MANLQNLQNFQNFTNHHQLFLKVSGMELDWNKPEGYWINMAGEDKLVKVRLLKFHTKSITVMSSNFPRTAKV